MSILPESENQGSPIVGCKALPAPASESGTQKQRRGFFRAVGVLLGLIHDYTAEDINRLKEAAIQEVETRPVKAKSETELKLAEAAERHARAEHLLAKAEKARAEARKTDADVIAKDLQSRANHATEIADAIERVVDSISRIKQQGGEVAFDEQRLMRLIEVGQLEAPKRTSKDPR